MPRTFLQRVFLWGFSFYPQGHHGAEADGILCISCTPQLECASPGWDLLIGWKVMISRLISPNFRSLHCLPNVLETSPSATGKWPCDLCQPFMGTWNPSARWCPCSCNGLSVTSGLWGELESVPLPSDAFFVSSTHCKCLIFSFCSPTQRTPVLLVEVSFFYLLLFQHPFKFVIQVESLVYIFCLRFDPASKGFLQKSVLS